MKRVFLLSVVAMLATGCAAPPETIRDNYLGQAVEVRRYGYPCKVYADSSADAMLTLVCEDGRLIRQEICLLSRIGLYRELEQKYGPGNIVPTGFVPEAQSNVVNFWNVSNKAVYYLRFPTLEAVSGGFDVLVYEDIIHKTEELNREEELRRREADSVAAQNRQQAGRMVL